MDKEFILKQVRQRYINAVGYDAIDTYLENYINDSTEEIYDTTIDHIGIDEMNILNMKVESIDTYFNVMDISDKEKDERKALAGLLVDVVLFLMSLIAISKQTDTENWWLSVDRATLIAENDTNVIRNYMDYQKAIENGAKYKVWHTERDNRVRKTHIPLNGAKKPIKEPFVVGNSLLLFPGDTSLNAEAKEIIRCRCVCKYK